MLVYLVVHSSMNNPVEEMLGRWGKKYHNIKLLTDAEWYEEIGFNDPAFGIDKATRLEFLWRLPQFWIIIDSIK